MAKESIAREWLLAHLNYPYEDWCLIWPFARSRREGRGLLSGGDDTLAHRAMCKMVHGPAPADKPQAVHSCGNGHLGCVNPRHLSWATNGENQLQRYAHGRPNPNANGNVSQFTPEQIETMRSQWGEFTQERLAEMYGVSIPTIQYYLKYRETRGHSGAKIKHWTPEEDEKLKEAIRRGYSHRQAAEFVGRPHKATATHTHRLGLKSGYVSTEIAARQRNAAP